MKKNKLGKKAIAILVAVAILIVAGGCFGITYAVLHRQLQTPNARVKSVNAEPNYTIDLVWDKISGAESYTVEYKYSLYPDEVFAVKEIGGTSLSIKMIKGELQFRIKSVGKYNSNTSEFSKWTTYNVQPLSLDKFRGFNFKIVEGKGYQINMDTFHPITYVYKGNSYVVNYYEIAVCLKEDEIAKEDLQPQTYSITQMEKGVSFYFPSGVWLCYVRPVLYVEYNGIKDYTQAEGLYELYNEEIDYTIIELVV
ncbi:MAG: hypothetical protein IKB56_04040 [Clostridia bacterium]|nr:hypothetical protein [Clostridia bacterium]